MFFHRTLTDTTVQDIGTQLGVVSTDIWLPLAACVPAKGSSSAPYDIADSTPVALLDKSTNTLVFNRLKLAEMLRTARHVAGRSLAIAPADVPSHLEVYVKWYFSGSKQVAAGSTVLHRSITGAEAVLEGSCFLKARPSRAKTPTAARAAEEATDQQSVDASTIANTLMSAREARAKAKKSNANFASRLQSCLADSDNKELLNRVDRVFQKTVEKLKSHGGEAPLHFVVAKEAREVIVAGVRWSRPDSRLLHRVFRPDGGPDSSVFKDATRQLLFLFVDDVLYSFPRRPDKDGAAMLDSHRCTRVAAQLLAHAKRGFRIVFIDHFPELHHGTAYALEAALRPLTEFYTQYCAEMGLIVSVFLSTVSNISAVQHRETFASFVLPQTGLYYYFISQLNASFEADQKLSTFVNPFVSSTDARAVARNEFCNNISLKTVSLETFVEGV